AASSWIGKRSNVLCLPRTGHNRTKSSMLRTSAGETPCSASSVRYHGCDDATPWKASSMRLPASAAGLAARGSGDMLACRPQLRLEAVEEPAQRGHVAAEDLGIEVGQVHQVRRDEAEVVRLGPHLSERKVVLDDEALERPLGGGEPVREPVPLGRLVQLTVQRHHDLPALAPPLAPRADAALEGEMRVALASVVAA